MIACDAPALRFFNIIQIAATIIITTIAIIVIVIVLSPFPDSIAEPVIEEPVIDAAVAKLTAKIAKSKVPNVLFIYWLGERSL